MGIPSVADRARAQLGNERYEAAAAAGGVMPLEEVIHVAGFATPGRSVALLRDSWARNWEESSAGSFEPLGIAVGRLG